MISFKSKCCYVRNGKKNKEEIEREREGESFRHAIVRKIQ